MGRLEKRGDTFVEKGVDIRLATDMLKMAHHNLYDTAILVTGDGDFEPLVEAVKEIGKHVENAYFKISYNLKKSCDKIIRLNEEFLKECLLSKE